VAKRHILSLPILLLFAAAVLAGTVARRRGPPSGFPRVTKVHPEVCAIGQPVTVHGQRFGTTRGTASLHVARRNMTCAIRSWSDTAVTVVLPETFLAIDAVLILYLNVVRGLVVYPQVIARRVSEELPFMATERILMKAVQAGGDRQDLHERLRQHSQAAAAGVKQHGRPNDLMERLRRDDAFAAVALDAVLDPRGFVGRAPEQVDEFLADYVEPVRRRYADALDVEDAVRV